MCFRAGSTAEIARKGEIGGDLFFAWVTVLGRSARAMLCAKNVLARVFLCGYRKFRQGY